MIWLLPPIVIFGLAVWEWVIKDPLGDSILDYVMMFFLAAMIAMVTAAFSLMAGMLIGLAFPAHPVKSGETPLVALRDKDGIQGSFFLGSGYIEDKQYYFFYAQQPDGAFTPGKVEANRWVRVYEQERSDAVLITYRWEANSRWAQWLSVPVNAIGNSYDIHVPRGTVRRGYTM